MKYYAMVNEQEYEVEVDGDLVMVNGEPFRIDLASTGEADLYSFLFDGRSYELLVKSTLYNYSVLVRGDQYQVVVEDERTRRLNAGRTRSALPDGEVAIKAPIPGLVVKLLVSEGEEIEENQPLLILEAMKMENEIRSPRSGVIKKIEVGPGQRVEQNAIMIVTEEAAFGRAA